MQSSRTPIRRAKCARPIPTDQLLALGMALYADRRTMEQRVRGIFARTRSAGFARVLAAMLCLTLGIGCFTTACQPRIAGVETLETLAAARSARTTCPRRRRMHFMMRSSARRDLRAGKRK